MTDDQYQDPNAQDEFRGETGAADEGQAQGDEARVDWKERAIRAEERANVYREERQRSPAPESAPPRETASQALARQVEEAKGAMPAYDPTKPETFWERQNAKDRLDELRHQLAETREQERSQEVAQMRYRQESQSTVQQIKGQYRANPAFAKVERQFDQLVSRMAPHVAADPNALTVVLKNLLFDAGGASAAAPPPGAPRGDYGSGAPANQPGRKGKASWQSDQHRAVGEMYGMSPEQYYDPAYNDHSDLAAGNGINVYGPIGGKR